MSKRLLSVPVVSCCVVGLALWAAAQAPEGGARPGQPPAGGPGRFQPGGFDGPPPAFGDGPPPGFRPPGGPGGPAQEIKLLEKFDKNGDQRLDRGERQAARAFLAQENAAGRGRRGPGGGRGRGPVGNQEPAKAGARVSPAGVASFPNKSLYDADVVRTWFLEFESSDWEKELSDFYHTDVEVPATLTVDGKSYKDVGVHFRGASSYFTVGEGRKRSLNLSVDFVHENQRLLGYRTLNLLNSHVDPTYLRSVLYYQAARDYIAAPKANYVRLVINGESWGVYVNAQQVNKDFMKEAFNSAKGARWKVPGSPRGDGGLNYSGEDVADYRKRYEIKSKDEPASWTALIQLCRVLNQTPAAELERKLAPLLDIDGALKFLALENVFINSDGYWIRASDFNLVRDEGGRFHVVPHDANETFRAPEGPGLRGGGGPGRGVELDPFAGSEDVKKPLLNRLLAVPELRARYLGYVRQIVEEWLDWSKVGPLAVKYQSLIADDVKADTHRLDSFEAFTRGVDGAAAAPPPEGGTPMRGPQASAMSLKSFVEQRRAFLLKHPEVRSATLPGRR